MPAPSELQPFVADALARGATIVTGNQRAARTLRRAFDSSNRLSGQKVWQPASVLAWESWVVGLWRNLLLDGYETDLLLNRTQEQAVWRSIILDDPERREILRSVDSLAEIAADAWHLINQYSALKQLKRASSNFETRAFKRWAAEFERRCKSQAWTSSPLLEERLSNAVEGGAIKIPGEILLIGFDEFVPARRALVERMRARGAVISELNAGEVAQQLVVVKTSNESEEIKASALWVRDRLNRSPGAKLAVIVPALEARRSSIERIFRRVLAPELEDIAAPNQVAPFEFSVGVKLAEIPLVRSALDILRWVTGSLPIERVSSLLISPYFAMGGSDRNTRAIFDAFELRRSSLLRPEVTLHWITEAVSQSKRDQPTRLVEALQALAVGFKRYSAAGSVHTFTEWVDIMRHLLRSAQWGRIGAEDSVEFQTKQRWEAALDEFGALDFDGTRLDYPSALDGLERLARMIVFAPASRETSVQVLGPLEAAGSKFDAIWFMGVGDQTWPASSSANPLLPWSLQAELGMPGTKTSTDDARSLKIAERIAASSDEVVFSFAAELKTGKQRPAPVIKLMGLCDASSEFTSVEEQVETAVPLEIFSDILPIPAVPDQTIQGGAEILRLQAACGFRAFAEKRLSSSDMECIDLGMNARERGNIVHQTLEYFWDEVRTQSALKAMTHLERQAAQDRAIEHGLRRAEQRSTATWDKAYLDVQRKRLSSLLSAWLGIELRREPFEVKLREKTLKGVRIGPLTIDLRVDRIDNTDTGDVIIDYKTGKAKPSEWLGKRPDAPQLPLYAVLTNELYPEAKLGDVVFANIHAGKDASFDGYLQKVTASGSRKYKKRIPIAKQMEEWRYVLTNLAEQFHRGQVDVHPKNYPATCTYCAQRTFCRLDPAMINKDEELDDQEESDTENE